MIEMLIDVIGDYEVTVMCHDRKECFDHLKIRHMIATAISEAISELRSRGYNGNEILIKKIIYDRWGQSGLDAHGDPL